MAFKRFKLKSVGSLIGSLFTLIASPAWALPGDTLEAVEAWIQGNATLSPRPGERLTIQRSDTPARRFTFQASMFPVAGAASEDTGRIRMEQLSLFDMTEGVSVNQLEEALRAIYGAELYTDYRQGKVLYTYPASGTVGGNPELVVEGQVRQGVRYAYWMELVSDSQGATYSGRLVLFIKDDLPQLRRRLMGAP